MQNGEKLYNAIVEICKAKNISIAELARMCEVDKRAIYSIKRCKRVKVTKIVKICRALDIRAQYLFDYVI